MGEPEFEHVLRIRKCARLGVTGRSKVYVGIDKAWENIATGDVDDLGT
ncbi:MAG: hypothetical protein AAGI72_18185 [Pseudomonadota bacterium]